MARIRQFKPSFFTDDKVGVLSRDARLFFFGVLSEADDEGRLVDSPKRLAGVVFPFDDDVTPKKIERWINELEAQRMVVRYEHDGGRFMQVRRFKEHQKMSHPTASTLPPPPATPPDNRGGAPEDFRKSSGAEPEGFAPVFEGVSVVGGVVDPSPRSTTMLGLVPSANDEMDQRHEPTPHRPPDPIAERLLTAWPENRRRRQATAALAAVDECRRWLDASLIDEVVGHMLGMAAPPATPRYLLVVAPDWAQQRGANLSAEALASMSAAAKAPGDRAAS